MKIKIQGMKYWLWPIVFSIAGYFHVTKKLNRPVHPDAEHVYLPAAQAWLEQGWSFLLSPESYRVVPLAYLWPALWGAEPESIRLANIGLWIGCVFFIWNTCHQISGRLAGLIALILFASHPLIPGYFATELTEPVFLFGLFGWIYAISRILGGGHFFDWTAVAIGAASLCITLLSRPVLQIIAPAIFLLATIIYFISQTKKQSNISKINEVRTISLQIAASTGAGLVLPILLILKNGLVFGLWGLGTGSGTGLYLGTNPLFQGGEPAFLGFEYDINLLSTILTGNGDHLSLTGDRIAREAAIWQVSMMSFMEKIEFFIQKIWWWAFHHPAQMGYGGVLRKIRFIEAAVIIFQTAWLTRIIFQSIHTRKGLSQPAISRSDIFSIFLLGMLALMLAQLIPILYNNRYSAGLLDPWVIFLTALGSARLMKSIHWSSHFGKDSWNISLKPRTAGSMNPFLAFIALVFISIVAGNYLSKKPETTSIRPHHMGSTKAIAEVTDGSRTDTYGLVSQGGKQWKSTEEVSALHILLDQTQVNAIKLANPLNAAWESVVAVSTPGKKSCKKLEMALRLENGAIIQPKNTRPLTLSVRADGKPQKIVVHANREMRPQAISSLRMIFHCPLGTHISWESTRFLESRHMHDAAAHIKASANMTGSPKP